MSAEEVKKRARAIFRRLKTQHADAQIELEYKTPLQLLIATILSAQCTDVQVNKVTKALFKKYKKPKDYLAVELSEFEQDIRATGFYRNKAKNIRAAVQTILDQHKGEVPSTMLELTKLPGVGRKTANVVLGNAFDIPGMPVDTHVSRISKRLGLTEQTDAVKIETELTALIPKSGWTLFSHTLIFHGRRTCKARKPLCEECSVSDLCDYFNETAA